MPSTAADSPTCSGPVIAEDNIINRRGGESLYQTCANLKRRLAQVPGFEPYLAEMNLQNDQGEDDPVASVWHCLRSGFPLVAIYNASAPKEPIIIDETKVSETKRPKVAAFKFLQACMSELHCPQQDCFLLTDLYSESTTGFVKVIKMVNRVLDILETQGQLYCNPDDTNNNANGNGNGATNSNTNINGQQPNGQSTRVKLTRREHVVKELIETERDYVLHMENLQALRRELELSGALSGDLIHQIFLNLHNLLDFAQKFLIGMEQHYARSEEKQNWGELFLLHREGFREYETFIANQTTCDALCTKEWNTIHSAPKPPDLQQMVAQLSTLNGFFLKPFQRLTKYPLILNELRKTTEQENLKTDLTAAIDMIQDVLDEANHAIDKEALDAAVADLASRMEDWKALKPETFGELVRHGPFTVVKQEGTREADREYIIYLFETVLICVKELSSSKQKAKLMGKEKSTLNNKGKTKVHLKGRVHMQNLHTITTHTDKPGVHKVHLHYRAEPDSQDNLIIKFPTEELMRQWHKELERLKGNRSSHHPSLGSISETESLQITGTPPYPYGSQNHEDQGQDGVYSDYAMSRTTSSTSLRTRSATQSSANSSFHKRFPMPDIPPIYTQMTFTSSPGERSMMSYFSNAHDNSSSVRSSQSTLYTNGSRQGTPTTVFSDEGVNRHTAPAMPRKNSREGSFAPTSAAKQQRPSLPTYAPTSSSTIPTSAPASRPPPSVLGPNGLPPGTHSHPGSLPPAAAAQARLRSASSPDIQQLHQHGHGGYAAYQHGHPHALRPANGVHAHKMQTVDNVPVPPIPPHVAGMRAPVVGVAGAMSANSSANNSSSSLNGLAPAPGTGVSLPNGSMPPPPVPGPVRYPHPAQGPTSNLAHASYPSGEAPESGRDDTPTASTPTLPSTPGAVAPPTNGNGVAPASPKTNRTSCHGMNNASISSTASAAVKMPVQLKAKINYEDNYVTLVVPVNTTFQSLTDRVDAKLKRFTDRSIGEDTVRLKYRDEDGDYIKIDSDDAVQCAFMDWRDQHQGMLENGQIGEINLFCQPV